MYESIGVVDCKGQWGGIYASPMECLGLILVLAPQTSEVYHTGRSVVRSFSVDGRSDPSTDLGGRRGGEQVRQLVQWV